MYANAKDRKLNGLGLNINPLVSQRLHIISIHYSHLSNNRGSWNKRGGSAKVAKSINVEVGINVEDGN